MRKTLCLDMGLILNISEYVHAHITRSKVLRTCMCTCYKDCSTQDMYMHILQGLQYPGQANAHITKSALLRTCLVPSLPKDIQLVLNTMKKHRDWNDGENVQWSLSMSDTNCVGWGFLHCFHTLGACLNDSGEKHNVY